MNNRSKLYLIFAACLTLSFVQVDVSQAQEVDSTWNGGNGLWSDASNWNPNGVPNSETGPINFNVLIDGGKTGVDSTVIFNLVTASILGLTIDDGDTLRIEAGRALTIFPGFPDASIILNNGSLDIDGVNAPARLILGDDVMVNGSGTINMFNDAQISSSNDRDKFTIGANQTIRGNGQLGLNTSEIDNLGIIDADSGTLTIDPGSTSLKNRNIMRASGGGRLRLTNGLFSNQNIIEAGNGSVVELDGGVIQDGTLNSVGTGVFRVENGKTGGIDAPFTLTNNATFEIGGVNAETTLELANNTRLGGNGNITLTSQKNSVLRGENTTDQFFNEANHTIRGTGRIGLGQTEIINNGTIDANVSGNILVVSTGTTRDLTNNSVLRASGGGILQLGEGRIDNLNGTIEAADGSVVEFNGGTVQGGTLTNSGTGIFRVSNGLTGTIRTEIQNNATIEVGGVNAMTTLRMESGGALSGTGDVILKNQIHAVIQGDGSDFSNQDNHTISGTGTISAIGDFFNDGTVNANVGGNILAVESTGTNRLVFNDNLMQASNGGILELRSRAVNSSGTVRAADNSSVRLNGGSIVGGTLESSNGSFFGVVNGQTGGLGDAVTNNAQFTVGGVNGTTTLVMEDGASISGNGSIRLSSQNLSVITQANANDDWFNGITHTISGQGTIGNNMGSILNAGTIRADGGQLRLNALGFNNFGLVEVNGGVLNIDNSYVQNGGTTRLAGNQTINASTQLEINSGFLDGDGTINGDVLLNGTIRTGFDAGGGALTNTAGQLDITNLDMEDFAVTEIELGGLLAGSEFDFINVGQNLDLDGDLQLSFINGFENVVTNADSFIVLESNLLSGTFDNIANQGYLAIQDGSAVFQVHYGSASLFNPNSVVLNNFRAVPEPSHYLGLLMLVLMTFSVRTRKRTPLAA